VNLESFRSYCLNKKGVTEEYPFDESTMVLKVMGKMFAAADSRNFTSINLKTDPTTGEALREEYPAIGPGYHMNKKHWITVQLDGSLTDRLLARLIDDSYLLVVSGLPRKAKAAIVDI
jgi:predicted DNA-binding protein (MmcQ/YjbR family)